MFTTNRWCMTIVVLFALSAGAAAQGSYPRAGWTAFIPPGAHDAEGIATILDGRTIRVDHFTYDGGAPQVYFYLGATDTQSDFINGRPIGPQLDRAYDDETITVQLPEGETLDGYGAISVWCAAFNVNFTSATFVPVGCRGDLDEDGVVRESDLGILLAHWGESCSRTLRLDFDGLEDLGSDYVYEGWLIVDGAPISTGRFSVDESGQAMPGDFLVNADWAAEATLFVLTIEPAVGDDPAPSATHYLAGAWDGASAELTIGHPAALGDDFSAAAGAFILQTPSTADIPDDYDQGIWWLDPAGGPGPSLALPVLPAGWAYEGWVVGGGGPVTTGRFLMTSGADSDGAGPDSGPDPAPPFPGQDYIDPPMVLTGFAAVITIEPEPDNSPGPFTLKPLIDMMIEDVGPGVLQSMENRSADAPTGTAMIVGG